jgi:hypothetical protein
MIVAVMGPRRTEAAGMSGRPSGVDGYRDQVRAAS